MSKTKEYIEALVFAFGDGITIEELSKRIKVDPLLIRKAVRELNKSYADRKSAFSISEEGTMLRMKLRHDLIPLIEENLKTDMKKGVLMTLSVIASRGKIMQSDLVKQRGSVSYQHVKELVSRGLVTAYMDGNKKALKLSPSFFDYFDINNKEFNEVKKEVKNSVEEEMVHHEEYSPK
ncbi:MAG: SMC-Scp complex subunit ScpB [Candidatus Parvarchaeota archaeon]|nr:SMC-Scp complex subunit ScpB [Candidatus Parvarchaeota archaeon]